MMSRPRINLHTHTLNSDGDSTPEEVVRWYREHGYQFLVLDRDDDPIERILYVQLDVRHRATVPDRVLDQGRKDPLQERVGEEHLWRDRGGSDGPEGFENRAIHQPPPWEKNAISTRRFLDRPASVSLGATKQQRPLASMEITAARSGTWSRR